MLSPILSTIGLKDIQQLIDDEVPESKVIEYKTTLYDLDSKDADRKAEQREELLKDLSAFANAIGGDLVIGVGTKSGVPTGIPGIPVKDVDALKLKISQIAQSGLEPRVGFTIHAISHGKDKAVLVIRVPQSTVSPHRVVYRRIPGQFWTRDTAGCHQMDVAELRQAFTATMSITERMRQLRETRVRAVAGGQAPLPLADGAKFICHLMPTESFTASLSLAPTELLNQLANLRILQFTGGVSPRFNLDGLLTCESYISQVPATGYVQTFRSGVIEAVLCNILHVAPNDPSRTPYFRHLLVPEMIGGIEAYLKAYVALGVPGPVRCFFTLTGVRGMHVYTSGIDRSPNPVDRDILFIPEVEIPVVGNADCERLLMPLFDSIWNAAGQPRCSLFYTEQGAFRMPK
jgi:hypothetical protein